MKKSFLVLIVCLALLGSMGCLEHQLRITNTSSYDFDLVMIDGGSWSNIVSSATSAYQVVEEGTHDILVRVEGSYVYSKIGEATISGTPLFDAFWTLSIGNTSASIERDE